MKQRLDIELVRRELVSSRSQAESLIRLGKVRVGSDVVTKAGFFVRQDAAIALEQEKRYVSRAGLKLASVVEALGLSFEDKVVLDVGSSTGGFTDYALQHGAKKVIAVDVGTDQMHPKLRGNDKIELHEKTDIRDFHIATIPDVVVIDVSFISLRQILPSIAKLSDPQTTIVAMVKPQFEAGRDQVAKGVIKNERIRRDVLKSFELWSKDMFVIQDKSDSQVAGAKGNRERFYLLHILR